MKGEVKSRVEQNVFGQEDSMNDQTGFCIRGTGYT